ncbi:caspase family protein [Sorangium sp. KYC3313]|uniref:caspase family protein n=1 Tax=Sorangium sp. KYC3313 TaxID=3449740 RepID=UPI003F88B05D
MSNGRFGSGAAGLGAIALAAAIGGCSGAPPAPSQRTQHTPAAPPEVWLPPGARLARPEGHLAEVSCLAFSPDGRQIVSGSEDRVLLVWDVATGQVVQRLEGHGGWIRDCAFLPDGRGVVSGGWGGEVFVWDRRSGERRRLELLSPTDAVNSLSVRPDGGEILVGTLFGVARAWELGSGAATLEQDALIRPGERNVVWATGYLDDGRAFAGGNAGVVVWNEQHAVTVRYDAASAVALPGGLLALGGEGEVTLLQPGGAIERLGALERWVYGLAVSPRRDLLLAGDAAGNARVFRLADRSLRCQLKRSAGLSAAAFDPTGTWFAVGGDDGSVALARVADCTGADRRLAVRQLGIAQRRMHSVAAGQAVLVGDGAGNVSAWSTATWSLVSRWSAHAGAVSALAALPDGGWVSGGRDHAVVAMPGVSSAPPRRIGRLRNFPWAVRPGPDGMSVLSADAAGDLTRLPLGEGGAPATLLSEQRPLYALAVDPGRPEAVVAGMAGRVLRVSLVQEEDRNASWPRATMLRESVMALAYSPDGRWLAEAGTDGTVAVRDAEPGDAPPRRFEGLKRQVHALVLTPDHLWAGGADEVLARWSIHADAAAAPLRIEEHAPIHSLAATPDGKHLIAALGHGRVSVRALPSGDLVAHLLPLSDGSWATAFADGRFISSGSGAALGLRFEDPATRKVTTLGGLPHVGVSPPSATRTAEGHLLVRATVFSPRGVPRVRLDGRWDVRGVIPSPTALSAYEVELLLGERSTAPHRLDVLGPGGETARADILPEPDLRARAFRPRALLIGNAAYRAPGVKRLPGALADVDAMRRALQRSDGWALDDDRIKASKDLDAANLEATVTGFLAGAAEGETLLVYFAGHGLDQRGEGFLLPIDFDPARPAEPRNALPAARLFQAIAASKAGRVLVILDAGRAGAFSLPEDLGVEHDHSERIGVVIAASAGSDAAETPRGGVFTQALAEAWTDPAAVDPEREAVTLGLAFNRAQDRTYAQRPRLFGGLDTLPLAWPLRGAAEAPAVMASEEAAASGSTLARVKATVVGTRQLTAFGRRIDGTLEVEIAFGQDTEFVRIGVYAVDKAPPAARPEVFAPGPWKGGQVQRLRVPLKDHEPGEYRVEVEPCRAGTACGHEPASTFRIPLGG